MGCPEILHDYCKGCQKNRRADRDGPLSELTGRPTHLKGEFIIDCNGIPGDDKFIPNYDKVVEGLAPEEIDLAQTLYDPVLWAEKNIGWTPRKSRDKEEYQSLVLRCSSKRKVLRMGRRLGKCLSLDSLVLTKEKGLIPIKDVYPGDTIGTLDDTDGQIKWTEDWYLQDNGEQEVYKLTTRLGNIDHITGNHPYLKFTEDGLEWTEVDDLKPGDRIAIPKTYEGMFSEETTDRAFYRLLGYLVSDGGTNYKSGVRFSNESQDTLDDLSQILDGYNCYLKSYGGVDYGIICDEWQKNPVLDICRENDLQHLAINKKIPAKVYSANNGDVAEFLGAAWDCDGWVSDNEIGYCSASYDLANGIKHLLKRFGINATLSRKDVRYQDTTKEAWTVGVYNLEDSLKFHANIKLIAKEIKLADTLSARLDREKIGNDWLHTFPKEIHSIIDRKLSEKKLKWKDIKRNDNCRQRKEYGPTYSKMAEVNEKLKSEEIDGWLTSNILFDEIKSIEHEGRKPTLDFSVGTTGNFIANDTITHNTEVMVISIMHYLFTNSPKVQRWDEDAQMYVDGFSTILVLTPYLSQVKLIFNRMRELLARNPELQNEVKKDVSTPHHLLELYNGAKVVGFSSGAKGAEAVRGQKADFIILDEMDYLSTEDIESVVALMMEHSGVRILASSTPSGRREYFYSFCEERMDFKQFYYPSMCNPAWGPKMEAELRQFYKTEVGWQHEILAEFGEAATGVFQHKYVHAAKEEYKYEEMNPQNGWTYSIGIDWNDAENGTKLCVVGWDPKYSMFRIVDKQTVGRHGWTQLAAIDELIKLNRLWQPDYVYVDEGYGACVLPDTKVLTSDGVKEIKDIRVGEEVLTHLGVPSVVYGIQKTEPKDVYRIKPRGDIETGTSAEHPFLAIKKEDIEKKEPEWIEARDLSENMLLASPKILDKGLKKKIVDLKDLDQNLLYDDNYVWYKNGFSPNAIHSIKWLSIESGVSVSTVERTYKKIKNNKTLTPLQTKVKETMDKFGVRLPEPIKAKRFIDVLDKTMLEIFGIYLAEGSSKNFVEIDLHKEERPLAESILKKIKKVFGLTGNIIDKKDEDTIQVTVGSKILGKFLREYCGTHSQNKRMHRTLIENHNRLAPLIKYMFIGDGHFHKKNMMEYSTVSSSLAYQLKQILISHDMMASIHKYRARKKENINSNEIYKVSVSNQAFRNSSYLNNCGMIKNHCIERKFVHFDEKYAYFPIRYIEKDSVQKRMVDIGVFSAKSFVGNGIALHNTQIEVIKSYGLEAVRRGDEHAGIDERLKNVVGVNFSSNVETYDPVTSEPIKKKMKPFMVENAVRRFEQQQIKISEFDDILMDQLGGYMIAKVNASGMPVYEAMNGDHDLDALMMALLAFQMELSEFTNRTYSTDITFSGRMGESLSQMDKPGSLSGQSRQESLSPQQPSERSSYGNSLVQTLPAANHTVTRNRRVMNSPEDFNNDDYRVPRRRDQRRGFMKRGGQRSRRSSF